MFIWVIDRVPPINDKAQQKDSSKVSDHLVWNEMNENVYTLHKKNFHTKIACSQHQMHTVHKKNWTSHAPTFLLPATLKQENTPSYGLITSHRAVTFVCMNDPTHCHTVNEHSFPVNCGWMYQCNPPFDHHHCKSIHSCTLTHTHACMHTQTNTQITKKETSLTKSFLHHQGNLVSHLSRTNHFSQNTSKESTRVRKMSIKTNH